MNRPKVTVVTPSLSQEKYIERTILSVLEQDYDNLEYIVVDGGSTDGSVEILKRYGDRLRWISERDSGQSEAINKGWRMASGEILAYLNSDDVYKPGAVSCAVGHLSEDPELLMVYSDVDVIDGDDGLIRVLAGEEWDLQRLISDPEYFIPQQGVFFRAHLLERIGFLDQSLHFKMDRDLYIRIGLQGRVKRISGNLGSGRAHAEAKQNPWNARKAWRESVIVTRRYGGDVSLTQRVRWIVEVAKQTYIVRPGLKVPGIRRLVRGVQIWNATRELRRRGHST